MKEILGDAVDDEDLEDGKIEDVEDEVQSKPIAPTSEQGKEGFDNDLDNPIAPKNKKLKSAAFEDDNVCAIVLKIRGRYTTTTLNTDGGASGQESDRTRCRKRKSEENAEHYEKKLLAERKSYSKRKSMNEEEGSKVVVVASKVIKDENSVIDDNEMMNVRVGSPPRGALITTCTTGATTTVAVPPSKLSMDNYDSYDREEDSSDKDNDVPRKLKLCKLYIKGRCGRRQCTNMHEDFPCKFYYLGMVCVKKNCLLMHGKPLSVELRNILLGHILSLPNPNLGCFKRIPREEAILLMTQRHNQLCQKFHVQNIWPPFRNKPNVPRHRYNNKQQQRQQLSSNNADLKGCEKTRKIHWDGKDGNGSCSNSVNSITINDKNVNKSPRKSSASDVSEIQMRTNTQAPDSSTFTSSYKTKATTDSTTKTNGGNSIDGISSRVLLYPDIINTQETVENCVSSNSNRSSAVCSGIVAMDYEQYLKDSNITSSDLYDDDNDDEPQLVIDENWDDNDAAADIEGGLPNKNSKDIFLHEVKDDVKNGVKDDNNKKEVKNDDNKNDDSNEMPGEKMKNNFIGGVLLGNECKKDADMIAKYLHLIRNTSILQRTDDEDSSNTNSNDSGHDSHSQTPTPEPTSSTPKPQITESSSNIYKRRSMYDCNLITEKKREKIRMEEADLRFPFKPVAYYPASAEIDASINTHKVLAWHLKELNVEEPNFMDLRTKCKDTQTKDPRLRRILGLPEITQSLSIQCRQSSASPVDNDILSAPRTEMPSLPPYTKEVVIGMPSFVLQTPAPMPNKAPARGDPRRAAAVAAVDGSFTVANNLSVEFRNILQKSEWYNNLGSNNKIMVNRQLALVSTELKKFHQIEAPNKKFDIGFIVRHAVIQQIFSHLGVCIDGEGKICHIAEEDSNIANDGSEAARGSSDMDSNKFDKINMPPYKVGLNGVNGANCNGLIQLPNMSQQHPYSIPQQQLQPPPPPLIWPLYGIPPHRPNVGVGPPPYGTNPNGFNPYAGPSLNELNNKYRRAMNARPMNPAVFAAITTGNALNPQTNVPGFPFNDFGPGPMGGGANNNPGLQLQRSFDNDSRNRNNRRN